MDAELKIKIGAETVEVTKSLDRLQQQLKTFKEALGKATDPRRVDLLNRSIEKTSAIIAGVKSFKLEGAVNSLSNVTKGSNQAGTALTNLGRVAQDLPFGFIGIANNLNPLLESFQRLRIETGSGKAALSALGSSLLGAGGLGIALSVVSAGISIASVGLDAWTRGFGDNKKAAEDQAATIQLIETDYDRYAKKLKEVIGIVSQEASKVSILVGALSDSNLPLARRKGILEELAKISPEYLKNLDAEKTSYQEIAKAVNSYIDGLAKQSELKALLPEFEKIVQRVVTAQVELNKLKREGNFDLLFGGGGDQFVNEESKRLQKIIDNGKKQISEARKALSFIAGGDGSLAELLFGKEIKDVEIKPKKVKVKKADDIDVGDLIKQVGSGAFVNSKFDTPLVVPLSIQSFTNRSFKDELKKNKKDLEDLQKANESLAKTYTSILTPAVTSFFDALIDGSKKPFDALKTALQQLLKQLTATIIKAAILAAITQAIGIASGTGNAGATFGSRFLGNLLGSLGGGLGGAGGINTGTVIGSANRGLGISGEFRIRGTELVGIINKTNGSINRGF